jgi:hypothetical protein
MNKCIHGITQTELDKSGKYYAPYCDSCFSFEKPGVRWGVDGEFLGVPRPKNDEPLDLPASVENIPSGMEHHSFDAVNELKRMEEWNPHFSMVKTADFE